MDRFKYRLLEVFYFFLFGFFGYMGIELLYRQRTTIEMGLLGGIVAIFLALLNNVFTYEMDYLLQGIVSAGYITFMELLFGICFNRDLHIWDYSHLPFNYFGGQICLYFTLIWFVLAMIFIPVLDYLEWVRFDKKHTAPPYYKIFGKKIDMMEVLYKIKNF